MKRKEGIVYEVGGTRIIKLQQTIGEFLLIMLQNKRPEI